MPLRRTLPVALAATALLLSGCGGDGEEPADGPAAQSQTTAKQNAAGAGPAGQAATAATNRARPAALGGLQAAAGDLSNFSCEQRGAVWSADGVVSNSADEPMVYTVTVVTVAGGEVSGHASDEILLDADESTPFELKRVSRGAADACMPRLVRAPR
jgi:hypothetical protein